MHTTYFTATVDDDGKVETYADIYKLDGVVAAAILGKEARVDAVADNAPPRQSQAGNSGREHRRLGSLSRAIRQGDGERDSLRSR